jgi:hypothetical protein
MILFLYISPDEKEDDAEMLKYIFSNIVHEPCVVYNLGFLFGIYNQIAMDKQNNFVQLYKE